MSNHPSPLGIVDALLEANVPLVVIGGHAVNFHGYIRATEDVDLVFLRDSLVEQRLSVALTELDAYWIGDEIDPKTGLEKTHPVTLDYVRQQHLLMLGTRLGFVDLFDFIPGLPNVPIEGLFDSAELSGNRPFASLDWLKRMKAAAGRPQDLIDLERLP